ncbi:MAG: DUF5916 domain-containing protein [Bacteroidetes bacterium]|nr:DUF5916 domain-containing protein [Bacteroidota bacterium]
MLKLFSIVFILFIATGAAAQDVDVSRYKENYKVHIKKAVHPVKLDGDLSEEDWQEAGSATEFWQKFPRDDVKGIHKTIARVLYDDKFFYAGFTVYDSLPLIGQSLKRDSRIRDNDGVGIMLDPMNKKTSGFYFTVTAFNVQADDLLTVNPDNLTFSWDNKWYSAVKRYTDHYTVEMAIPFKTLRYNKDNTIWGINFIRSDRKLNEIQTWTRIPLNFASVDLGYLGALHWDQTPPSPGSNISLIPYFTGNIQQNKEDGISTNGSLDAGFDAKVALTSSLNLDLTVNPDFSQVEVDRQVTNLSRFSIFFPERRNFFLENSDLFSEYGIPPIRPFYSRRIGLDPDGNPIPILAGARVTGNIASRTRVGLMTMQTKATDNYAGQNYTALTVQQQMLKRTTFKAYFFNRQGFFDEKNKLTDPLDEYGRNAGGEFYYVNQEGEWQGWLGFHTSHKPGRSKDNLFLNGGGGYFGRSLTSFIDYDNVGTNYFTDIGFVERIENYDALRDTVIRLGFKQFFNNNQYTLYPKKGIINQHSFSLENFLVFNPDNTPNEASHELGYTMQFKNTASIEAGYTFNTTHLQYHTSFTDGVPLPPARYRYNQFSVNYQTDIRKKFSFEGGITAGNYFSGNYLELTGSAIFRSQPWLTIEMNAEYYRLRFPGVYGKENFFLLAPRVEINFSNNLFWTTFIQYNTQRNNININSRLQWRYKPASDLFLVYTDNYFSDPLLKNKNRSFVFKLNYWLNL